MRRYFLSPVIGSGGITDPYRAKIADFGVGVVALIPTNAQGQPTSAWALCLVNAPNHTALLSDRDIKALPDFPLDAKFEAMSGPAISAGVAALSHFDIPLAELETEHGYREFIRSLGQRLEPAFNESNFDTAG